MASQPSWKQNEKIRECFDSLPKAIQENIMQSGADFNSAEEMKNCAESITNASNSST